MIIYYIAELLRRNCIFEKNKITEHSSLFPKAKKLYSINGNPKAITDISTSFLFCRQLPCIKFHVLFLIFMLNIYIVFITLHYFHHFIITKKLYISPKYDKETNFVNFQNQGWLLCIWQLV